jgi:hypothetical protein
MKTKILIMFLLFALFGLENSFSQVTTENDIRKELTSIWNKYSVFKIPTETSSTYADGLRQFGDRFWGILDGSGDDDMQTYYFAGRTKDMFIIFLGGEFAEYMAETNPDEYFLTNERNKDFLRQYIKRWQDVNGITGKFF